MLCPSTEPRSSRMWRRTAPPGFRIEPGSSQLDHLKTNVRRVPAEHLIPPNRRMTLKTRLHRTRGRSQSPSKPVQLTAHLSHSPQNGKPAAGGLCANTLIPGLLSGRPDLNRGPHRPERCALPGCATPRLPQYPTAGEAGLPAAPAGAHHPGGQAPLVRRFPPPSVRPMRRAPQGAASAPGGEPAAPAAPARGRPNPAG